MRLSLTGMLVLAACACTPATPPPPADAGPPPPPPPAPTVTTGPADQRVYSELVEAGCLQASSDGLQSVAGLDQGPHDPWLDCLYDGGSVPACKVPDCLDDGGASRRKTLRR